MSFIIGDIAQIRKMVDSDNGKIKDLWEAMAERTKRHTACAGLLQPDDTQEWWHLIWERLSDAAFVQAVSPAENLGNWLHEVVLKICEKPDDEWIGPWYRPRKTPPEGQLETAHIGLAVATVLELCPEIFSVEENNLIRRTLRSKCQTPCRVFLDNVLAARERISNWFMVLLNGFGTVSAVLGDDAAVRASVGYYNIAKQLYNHDSYGESLQYCNYATLHLSHLYEILIRYDPKLGKELDIGCYARMLPWEVSSLLYRKRLSGWGDSVYPRTVNFGDCAAIFRPSGDVLMNVAARAKTQFPKEAGLARWLFEETYEDTQQGPTSRASFGFVNSFQFFSILLYGEAAPALTPEEAGLPLLTVTETGNILLRDRWKAPEMTLGIQGGFQPYHITAHRHQDQNSFVLAFHNERFFADPGHCCYRLKSQSFSASAHAHNTWTFFVPKDVRTQDVSEGGNMFEPGSLSVRRTEGDQLVIEQKIVGGNIFAPTSFFNRLQTAEEHGRLALVVSDAAEIYGAPIRKAQRIWLCVRPNLLFILDRIEAECPVKVQTHFNLNNRDGRLRVQEKPDGTMIFQRGGAALKFFPGAYYTAEGWESGKLSYDWGYVHDCYHPLPNQKGQGAEGSGLIYDFTSDTYQTSWRAAYLIAMDDAKEIGNWEMKASRDGKTFTALHREKEEFSLSESPEGDLVAENTASGKKIKLSTQKFSLV